MEEEKSRKDRNSLVGGNVGRIEGDVKDESLDSHDHITSTTTTDASRTRSETNIRQKTTQKISINSSAVVIFLILAVVLIVAMVLYFVHRNTELTIGLVKPPPQPYIEQSNRSDLSTVHRPASAEHATGPEQQSGVSSQIATARKEAQPASAAPKPVRLDDKGIVMVVDTRDVPDGVNPRSELLKLKEKIARKGWNIKIADAHETSTKVNPQGLSRKYGCRYVLTGRLAFRTGDSTATLVPGTSLQFAHCSGELILLDTLTGDERSIFSETVKDAGNSLVQAQEKAARTMFEKMDTSVPDAIG
ncbi:hypothetical protein JXA40_07150 [bacterium]|nr:hypothetical protein [candidate division CSSED10-310 bacterium]